MYSVYSSNSFRISRDSLKIPGADSDPFGSFVVLSLLFLCFTTFDTEGRTVDKKGRTVDKKGTIDGVAIDGELAMSILFLTAFC